MVVRATLTSRPEAVLLPVLLLIGAMTAEAEIYKCDGQWTNKPCAGRVEEKLDEVVRPGIPADPGATPTTPTEPLAPRYAIVRRLRKMNEEFRSRSGVTLSRAELELFEDRCTDRAVPFAECQDAFNTHTARLKELSLQAEENDIAQEKNDIERSRLTGIPAEGER